MTNIEKYLNKVVDYVMKHPHNHNTTSFNDYCKHTFGLTDDEVSYVFYRWRFELGWDQNDRSRYYLKKIIFDNY